MNGINGYRGGPEPLGSWGINTLTRGRAKVGKIIGQVAASAGEIGSSELASSAVTAAKIAADAVTSLKLAVSITNQSNDATIAPNSGMHLIQNSTANASALYTLSAPTAGDRLLLMVDSYSTAGADSLKVTHSSTAATFLGNNKVALFNAVGDGLDIVATSTAVWAVVNNIGSVTFAATT